jgi:hypothetical protein
MRLSVIVPTLDEEATIASTLAHARGRARSSSSSSTAES